MERLGWTAVGAVVGGSAVWAISRFGKRALALGQNAPLSDRLEESPKGPNKQSEAGEQSGAPNTGFAKSSDPLPGVGRKDEGSKDDPFSNPPTGQGFKNAPKSTF
jgi:hypothetical protein